MLNLILASASPRRQDLLKQIGLNFDVIPSTIEEHINLQKTPVEIVKELSFNKANDIAGKVCKGSIVIGADTIVEYQNKILGKPKDMEHAYEILKMLSGNVHHVLTGFTVISTTNKKIITDYEMTTVKFRELSDDEIRAYIQTGEPMDKAGSYGIQKIGSLIVERIEGDYFNVVGLPVMKIALVLKQEFGINIL